MPKLVDAHCHLNFSAFKNDFQEVIERALKNDIWLINVGSQFLTSKQAAEMTQNYKEGVYAAVGLHPIHVEDENFDGKKYLELAKSEKVAAIGECGLDYYQKSKINQNVKLQFKIQKEIFIKHIELAKEVKKPLMIHCRDASSVSSGQAFDDLIEILNKFYPPTGGLNSPPGVLHFFTGTKENAKTLLDMGFYFTFGGLITFNRDFDEIIKFIPLERIMLETDAPYVSPEPYRGQRNEPLYIVETAKKLAEIKGVAGAFEEIAEQTVKNAGVVFGLKI